MSDELKRQASLAALDEIRPGMVVGLGTGSTVVYFIQALAERARAGLDILGIPTSEASRKLAEEGGIRLTTLGAHPFIDVTVDGADEVSPQLEMIKGLGGALVREKIVAHATKRVVIVVDESKMVGSLGLRTAIPVEVVPFAVDFVVYRLAAWGGQPRVRENNGRIFTSDNGNHIVDWKFGEIRQPALLEKQLKSVTGIVDCGLFCQVAEAVIIAGADGIRKIERKQ